MKTADIPSLANATERARATMTAASSMLRFLRDNCVTDGASYVLHKAPDAQQVCLYELFHPGNSPPRSSPSDGADPLAELVSIHKGASTMDDTLVDHSHDGPLLANPSRTSAELDKATLNGTHCGVDNPVHIVGLPANDGTPTAMKSHAFEATAMHDSADIAYSSARTLPSRSEPMWQEPAREAEQQSDLTEGDDGTERRGVERQSPVKPRQNPYAYNVAVLCYRMAAKMYESGLSSNCQGSQVHL